MAYAEVSDLNILFALLRKMRFAGRVRNIGPDYGFIQIDDTELSAFLHRNNVVDKTMPWDSVKAGDRVRFGILESKEKSGKLLAVNVTREPHL